MATSIVQGGYVNYGDESTFIDRIVDKSDGNNLSPIDNFISPVYKEFIFKNDNVKSKVKVDFLNVDNLWHFPNLTIKSISNINK
jgi:hypothetical protein